MKPAMTSQQERFTSANAGPLQLYKETTVGDASWGTFLCSELFHTLVAPLGGILGYGLRSWCLPQLVASCGRRPLAGPRLTVRGPRSIILGDRVIIDEGIVLDARGGEAGITISDYVSIGRFTTIAAKGGRISLAEGVNIGSYARLATQTSLTVGESTLIAAYCYIGPGNHQAGDDETPLIAQEMENRGGVAIGSHVWIGARATILDGVTIGNGAIVGAHSLVREDVPPGAVVAGTPARIIREQLSRKS